MCYTDLQCFSNQELSHYEQFYPNNLINNGENTFKQKTENIEKSRKPEDKLSPQKRHENIKLKLDHYNQEIRNFYEKYK